MLEIAQQSIPTQTATAPAAEMAGFSYKTAWDAVNAINNLLPRPAFITRTGGSRGGGAEVTDEGRRLIAAFRRLEEKLGRISTAIAEEGLEKEQDLLFWGLGVKLSVRNAFHCKIVEILPAPVDVEVKLEISPGSVLTSVVTNTAVQELGLSPGRSCVAMVNASSVMLAPNETPHISARNRLAGTVISRVDDEVNSEITIDLGGGKTIVSVITREGADDVAAMPGAQVLAIFKTSHVFLASD